MYLPKERKAQLLEIRHVDSTPELRDVYEEIYEGQGILHSDSFYRWILKLIRPEPGKRFLDVRSAVSFVIPRPYWPSSIRILLFRNLFMKSYFNVKDCM